MISTHIEYKYYKNLKQSFQVSLIQMIITFCNRDSECMESVSGSQEVPRELWDDATAANICQQNADLNLNDCVSSGASVRNLRHIVK